MSQNTSLLYIDTREQLASLCQQLAEATLIALDTEFVREKTYHARLCLIQIAADDTVACIDPLAIDDISPLLDLLNNTRSLKILHAARQDLEIFHDIQQKLPCPVFDTQIAASLLGYGDQIGYAALISKVMGINLDKDHARTDWSQRPLTPQQLEYAANDVRYLLQAYHEIAQQLDQTGRTDWLREDFATLCEPGLYITRPEDAWQRVKGINRLKPRQLAALHKLAAWREQKAISANKPRRWILSDDHLMLIAQLLPADQQALTRIRGLSDAVINKSGAQLLDCVEQARQLENNQLPQPQRGSIPDAEQSLLADFMMVYVKLLAKQHNISPNSLASRKEIDSLVAGNSDIPLMKGWKGHLIGDALQNMLAGNIALYISDNRLTEK